MKKRYQSMIVIGCLAAAALSAQGCGKKETAAPTGSTTRVEAPAQDRQTAAAAEGGAEEAEEQTAELRAAAEETAEALPDPVETNETYPGTLAVKWTDEPIYYGVMYARIVDVQTGENGRESYSLQDMNDTENVWTLGDMDIGDIEVEMERGAKVSLLFSGDIIHDAEHVEFIAAVPYTTYVLGQVNGTTENNMMSTFTLRSDDGQEIVFTKDNCRIEDGAMSGSAGDRVSVFYAYDEAAEIYYPLEVLALGR